MVAAMTFDRSTMSSSVHAVEWVSMSGRLSARTLYLLRSDRLPSPLSSPAPGVAVASSSVHGRFESVLLRLLVTNVRLPIVLTR